MTLSLNKPRLDNLADEIWKSAERLRGKFKAYEYFTPREVIVAHNHPAGGVEPSSADVEATKQLKAAGAVMGVALLDHIIFNRSTYFSFLEAGRL